MVAKCLDMQCGHFWEQCSSTPNSSVTMPRTRLQRRQPNPTRRPSTTTADVPSASTHLMLVLYPISWTSSVTKCMLKFRPSKLGKWKKRLWAPKRLNSRRPTRRHSHQHQLCLVYSVLSNNGLLVINHDILPKETKLNKEKKNKYITQD